MSDRLTGIRLPNASHPGIAEYGSVSVEEMIRRYRASASRQKREAEEILAAEDGDFRVDTYVGPRVMRNLEILQEGRPHQLQSRNTLRRSGQ